MYVLLDIDGVMVHAIPNKSVDMEEDGFYKFSNDAVNTLNSLLNEGDEIVLTTSHRFRYTLDEWHQILTSRGVKDVKISIVTTNIISRKDMVINYIETNNLNLDDILIIDDDKSLNALPPEFKKRLILTNPYTGLNSIN